MTACCICIGRGLERRAAPVKGGSPLLCVECREDAARTGEARRAAGDDVFAVGHDSAAVLSRYAARLTLAGGLATMPTAGAA